MRICVRHYRFLNNCSDVKNMIVIRTMLHNPYESLMFFDIARLNIIRDSDRMIVMVMVALVMYIRVV